MDKMLDSIDKGKCPKSGEFVRIYLEAGIKPASGGFRGRYLAGISFAWPEWLRNGQNSGLDQLTHQPTEWRKTFVMECYSSFGLNNAILYGCNNCRTRNERSINILIVMRSVHLPPLRRIGKERASAYGTTTTRHHQSTFHTITALCTVTTIQRPMLLFVPIKIGRPHLIL
jgi:hypothetical protein